MKEIVNGSTLTAIADAIRTCEGSTGSIAVSDFATRITNLPETQRTSPIMGTYCKECIFDTLVKDGAYTELGKRFKVHGDLTKSIDGEYISFSGTNINSTSYAYIVCHTPSFASTIRICTKGHLTDNDGSFRISVGYFYGVTESNLPDTTAGSISNRIGNTGSRSTTAMADGYVSYDYTDVPADTDILIFFQMSGYSDTAGTDPVTDGGAEFSLVHLTFFEE